MRFSYLVVRVDSQLSTDRSDTTIAKVIDLMAT